MPRSYRDPNLLGAGAQAYNTVLRTCWPFSDTAVRQQVPIEVYPLSPAQIYAYAVHTLDTLDDVYEHIGRTPLKVPQRLRALTLELAQLEDPKVKQPVAIILGMFANAFWEAFDLEDRSKVNMVFARINDRLTYYLNRYRPRKDEAVTGIAA